jgi:hypothetical protein
VRCCWAQAYPYTSHNVDDNTSGRATNDIIKCKPYLNQHEKARLSNCTGDIIYYQMPAGSRGDNSAYNSSFFRVIPSGDRGVFNHIITDYIMAGPTECGSCYTIKYVIYMFYVY